MSVTSVPSASISSPADVDLLPGCVDQPELANCRLIVYARLCSNQYYSSFCCASCASQRQVRAARRRPQRRNPD